MTTVPSQWKYHFGKTPKEGYISVRLNDQGGVPLFDPDAGYGFVKQTCAFPPREVHIEQISWSENGFVIRESEFFVKPGCEADHYNRFGMVFRIAVPPGAYEVYVRTTSDAADTTVSISGMQGERLLGEGYWDAAGLVPIRTVAKHSGKEWRFTYVNGRNDLDIEIEPIHQGVLVGVEEIILQQVPPNPREDGDKPAIFLLGDSTVKSYVFEEAPMSGWGQVLDRMFDLDRVTITNYSMGGRSLKNAYHEGRLNDILMTGRTGDFIFLQSGHNDEREDEGNRWGRGAVEATYRTLLRDWYIPAIRSRGMIPILVTPMSRVKGDAQEGHRYTNSFQNRRFPEMMKQIGEELGVTVIDLNTESVKYYNEIGVEAVTALYMSIEAGETPGKTNDGSFANGHPSNKIDGTHFKEALSKQFARIIVTKLSVKASEGNETAACIASFFKEEVASAIRTIDWSEVFPEIAKDVQTGSRAYYRNQIEKMIQLGAMYKDEHGNFKPEAVIYVGDFLKAICTVMHLDSIPYNGDAQQELTREVMGSILYDAYRVKFSQKPKYMTDYNGKTITAADPRYDANLDFGAVHIQYDPIVPYEQLTDTHLIRPEFAEKVKQAYQLGLIRAEKGIVRGKVMNGTALEPRQMVSRAKAAKALYFMWVLVHPVHIENHRLLAAGQKANL
ncbi:GDSL-type esterase/lipase family protein [Marinicrinis lubricantis]|uniref:GDSL-type esterase/lipase family protein n=1 Tax=Marinicrinis lubricantis TaxID=2086470 RepID=A0ABW1IWB9_9BACL